MSKIADNFRWIRTGSRLPNSHYHHDHQVLTYQVPFQILTTTCLFYNLGIGSFTIVDGKKVTEEDLGNK